MHGEQLFLLRVCRPPIVDRRWPMRLCSLALASVAINAFCARTDRLADRERKREREERSRASACPGAHREMKIIPVRENKQTILCRLAPVAQITAFRKTFSFRCCNKPQCRRGCRLLFSPLFLRLTFRRSAASRGPARSDGRAGGRAAMSDRFLSVAISRDTRDHLLQPGSNPTLALESPSILVLISCR